MPPKVTSATNSGPNTPREALEWAKEAVSQGRYRQTKHLAERIIQRDVTLDDVLAALEKGHRAEAYPDLAQRGGSTWRIFGRDPRGQQLAVGIEAYLDDEARWAILCTVIDVTTRRR